MGATDRKAVFGNASFAYVGGEVGASVQLGGLLIDTTLTALAPAVNWDAKAPGLAGLQFAAKFTFVLPWGVTASKPGDSNKEQIAADDVASAKTPAETPETRAPAPAPASSTPNPTPTPAAASRPATTTPQ
jgi:hypothetical protein